MNACFNSAWHAYLCSFLFCFSCHVYWRIKFVITCAHCGRDTSWSYECQRVKWESSAVVIEMGEWGELHGEGYGYSGMSIRKSSLILPRYCAAFEATWETDPSSRRSPRLPDSPSRIIRNCLLGPISSDPCRLHPCQTRLWSATDAVAQRQRAPAGSDIYARVLRFRFVLNVFAGC